MSRHAAAAILATAILAIVAAAEAPDASLPRFIHGTPMPTFI